MIKQLLYFYFISKVFQLLLDSQASRCCPRTDKDEAKRERREGQELFPNNSWCPYVHFLSVLYSQILIYHSKCIEHFKEESDCKKSQYDSWKKSTPEVKKKKKFPFSCFIVRTGRYKLELGFPQLLSNRHWSQVTITLCTVMVANIVTLLNQQHTWHRKKKPKKPHTRNFYPTGYCYYFSGFHAVFPLEKSLSTVNAWISEG